MNKKRDKNTQIIKICIQTKQKNMKTISVLNVQLKQ